MGKYTRESSKLVAKKEAGSVLGLRQSELNSLKSMLAQHAGKDGLEEYLGSMLEVGKEVNQECEAEARPYFGVRNAAFSSQSSGGVSFGDSRK